MADFRKFCDTDLCGFGAKISAALTNVNIIDAFIVALFYLFKNFCRKHCPVRVLKIGFSYLGNRYFHI